MYHADKGVQRTCVGEWICLRSSKSQGLGLRFRSVTQKTLFTSKIHFLQLSFVKGSTRINS